MEYEINNNTLAVIYHNDTSEIVESKNTYYVENIPNNIIKHSCEYFGSSLKGRLTGSKNMLGMLYKLPVIIEESTELIFMPTTSIENKTCSWINIASIKDYYAKENNVIVEFVNNEKRKFEISYFSFETQLFRASKLLLILKQRKQQKA